MEVKIFGATACKLNDVKVKDSERKELGVGEIYQIHDKPKRTIIVDYETEYVEYNIDRFNARIEPANDDSKKQLTKLKTENIKLKESYSHGKKY